MVDVRRAEATDAGGAASALASAFSGDPFFRWMLADEAPPEARLRPMFGALVAHGLRDDDHLVFVDDEGHGCAVWRPIDRWKVAPLELVRSAPAFVRTFRHRLPASMRALSAIEKVHPTEPHYYLEFLGTRRDVQGRGVGSAIISEMLDRCDREGVPAYLESSNPENIPFYARHGFVERGEVVCGKGAPVCTPMWRDPR